jgi:hypothetical protein
MNEQKYTEMDIITDAIVTLDNLKMPSMPMAEIAPIVNNIQRVRSNLAALQEAIVAKEKAQQAALQAQEAEDDEGTLGGDGSDGLPGGEEG